MKISKKTLFRGVCASSVTPFDQHGRLQLKQLKPHIDWLIAEGVNAISPLGSSGEFAVLEVADRKRVLDAALDACAGRVPVIVGTHHVSTRVTVELSQHAERAGANALLIVPPYYMVPTLSQTMDHFRRVAAAVSIPLVLYHNVPMTGVDLKSRHLLQLFDEGAIAGVKMSHPDPDRMVELLQATSGNLAVFAGIDAVAFEGLCHGAHGWISGIPSLVPRMAGRLYETIAGRGDLAAAREIWAKLAPLMRLQFDAYLSKGDGAHWFSVMKTGLNMIGPNVGYPALPIQPLSTEHRRKLAGLLRDLGYAVRAKVP